MSTTAVDWSGGFEPFGADYSGASEVGVFLRFPGQWVDGSWEESADGSETFNNVHRWYLSSLGGYSRPDPLGYLRYRSASTISAVAKDELLLNVHPFLYSSARPPRLIDPLGLKCESGCDDCPGGFWLGGGVKGDAMASVGIGIGGNIGLVRVFCTSSSLSCDLVVVCLKVIGAGGSAGVTFTGGFTGTTKCAEDLESVTVGVDLDGGGGLYASGGIQSAPGRSLKKSGFGGQIEVGIGFGLSGGLAICKAIRIGCR